MKAALNIVRGAVAKKSMVPVLTHIRVYSGRIQGGNGRYCIDAPCPELVGFDFCVPADRFAKAVDACDGEPIIRLTEGGRVTLSKGKFRAVLPTAEVDSYPLAERERGAEAVMLGDWLPPLRALSPFIGEDASKPWAMGVWLADDGYMYATNNTTAVRIPSPWSSLNDQLILPGFLVDELLRLGKEPLQILYNENVVTITFEDDSWLQGRLLEGRFPEQIKNMIPATCDGEETGAIKDALARVRPFCPDAAFPVIQMSAEGLSTAEGEMSAVVGGMVLPDLKWHADVLGLVLEHATRIQCLDVPCSWSGEQGLAGVAMPLRD